jgi:hypothetical protein
LTFTFTRMFLNRYTTVSQARHQKENLSMMSSTLTHMRQRKPILTGLISKITRLFLPIGLTAYGVGGFIIIQSWWFVIPFMLGFVLFFKGKLNALYIMGPLFWTTKTSLSNFSIGVGSMHQISKPWKKGKGIYVGVAKRVFLIGLCKKQDLSETEGILSAVNGRYLDVTPKEIGDWGVEKNNKKGK